MAKLACHLASDSCLGCSPLPVPAWLAYSGSQHSFCVLERLCCNAGQRSTETPIAWLGCPHPAGVGLVFGCVVCAALCASVRDAYVRDLRVLWSTTPVSKFTGQDNGGERAIMGRQVARVKSKQRGFTLVEILVATAILTVLEAFVIPTVSDLLDIGIDPARHTELHNVQVAVIGMMTDAGISSIPAPVAFSTGDMTRFPDATTRAHPANTKYLHVLFDAALGPDDDPVAHYLMLPKTLYCYTVNGYGSVSQHETLWLDTNGDGVADDCQEPEKPGKGPPGE